MADARAAEYQSVIDQAAQATASGASTTAAVRRLRAELRRIGRRDFFPPPERDRAHAAVRTLADEPGTPDGSETDEPSRPQTADVGDVPLETTHHQEEKS